MDGHVIYSEKLGIKTDHYVKMRDPVRGLEKLNIRIDVQIRKFEMNGHAKPGELEYLRNFRQDLEDTCNTIRRLGEIPCGFSNAPKP